MITQQSDCPMAAYLQLVDSLLTDCYFHCRDKITPGSAVLREQDKVNYAVSENENGVRVRQC